jgi:methylated-DNA-[protein]-cysteine S-methyltransferase
MQTRFTTYMFLSPIGKIVMIANHDDHIIRLYNETHKAYAAPVGNIITLPSPILREAEQQIRAYFKGRLKRFDLPLAPQGTDFQQSVWQELQNIPYGTTISYHELASRVNRPKAFRPVASANAKNPISFIIPCHRVIGKDGRLAGYAGGVDLKKRLLDHEASYC